MSSFEDSKFRLARIGALDISQLQNDPEVRVVWQQIRTEVAFTLRKAGESIAALGHAFPTFQVDMWTDFPWAFVTERKSLVVRLWSLLFASTFKLCGGLVHEANHFRYLKKRGMLGKPDRIQEQFAKKHMRRMEILAHEEELRFLRRAAPLFPDQIGVLMPKGYLTYSKIEIIEKCRRSLSAWTQAADYSREYERKALATGETNYERVAEALGIELPQIRDNRSITVRFWQ